MKQNPFNKYLSKEDLLQNEIINYIKVKYKVNPIPLNTESNKTPFERFKSKTLGLHRGIPDIFIPVANKHYHGLFIELKAGASSIYKKNGELRKSEHLEIQSQYHKNLISEGYEAQFCEGFNQAKKLVDDYFRLI